MASNIPNNSLRDRIRNTASKQAATPLPQEPQSNPVSLRDRIAARAASATPVAKPSLKERIVNTVNAAASNVKLPESASQFRAPDLISKAAETAKNVVTGQEDIYSAGLKGLKKVGQGLGTAYQTYQMNVADPLATVGMKQVKKIFPEKAQKEVGKRVLGSVEELMKTPQPGSIIAPVVGEDIGSIVDTAAKYMAKTVVPFTGIKFDEQVKDKAGEEATKFAVEILTDPINYVGFGAAGNKIAKTHGLLMKASAMGSLKEATRVMWNKFIKTKLPGVAEIPAAVNAEKALLKASTKAVVESEIPEAAKIASSALPELGENAGRLLNVSVTTPRDLLLKPGKRDSEFLKGLTTHFTRFGDTALRKEGPTADKIANMLQLQRTSAEVNMAKGLKLIQKVKKSGVTKDELQTGIANVLEGKAAATSPTLKNAVEMTKSYLDDVANRIESYNARHPNDPFTILDPRTGKEQLWTRRANYFPHTVDKDQEALIRELISKKIARDRNHAKKLIKQDRRKRVARAGNLEVSRVSSDLPYYETDVTAALPRYIQDVEKRLAQAEMFGAKNTKFTPMLKDVVTEGGNPNVVETVFTHQMGLQQPPDKLWNALQNPALAWQVMTKMYMSGINNMGAMQNVAALYGVTTMLKSIKTMMTKEGKDFALRAGATLQAALDGAIKTGGAQSKLSNEALEAFLFNFTEQFARGCAANAAREALPKHAMKLAKKPADRYLRQQFGKLGLNPDDIIARGGNLTEDEMLMAANRTARRTMGGAEPLDQPLFMTNRHYKFLTQYKNYISFQLKFFKDEVVKEAARGNIVPMARAFTAAQGFGEITGGVNTLVTGRKRPDWETDPAGRMLSNLLATGSLGLLASTIQADDYGGQAAVAATMAGATVSDIAKGIHAGLAMYKKDLKPAMRFAADQASGIGTAVGYKLAGPVGAKAGALLGSAVKVGTNRILRAKSKPKKTPTKKARARKIFGV